MAITSRRGFLHTTALGAAALGLPVGPWHEATGVPAASAVQRAATPLRLLILGGTGFIGPHQVRHAVARGHKVTVFNRGRREADLPDEVEHLQGDRNADLASLKGRTWDIVLDNPTTLPNWVRLSGELLEHACRQYVFISTISVYADTSAAGMDETTRLAEYNGVRDPFGLSVQDIGRFYGALKALSEREVERWFPGRATIIRPGLIVGPGDDTDRFTYWPARLDRGGEVLAPGTAADPTQIIDVRDLAEWTVRVAEAGTMGTFNATGPEKPRPIGDMLAGVQRAIGSKATLTWVDQAFLAEHKARAWTDLPVWVPNEPDMAGFMRVSVERAKAKGLTYRPLDVTARDTLAFHKSRPAERQKELKAGLTAEREAELLAAWHARPKPAQGAP